MPRDRPASFNPAQNKIVRDGEDYLTIANIHLAEPFGRNGYRRLTALLWRARWRVNEVKATVAKGRVSAADGLPHRVA